MRLESGTPAETSYLSIDEWRALSADERAERWPRLTEANRVVLVQGGFTAPGTRPQGKPASATCCHVLAVLSFLGGAAAIFLTVTAGLADGVMVAIGCFASGVLWWALGDIVAGVDRIARR